MTRDDAERMAYMGPLLDQAVELPPEALRAWLAELSLTDPGAARALEALFASEARLNELGFLTGSARRIGLEDTPTLSGTRIGAYTLERRVGQGGMGSVWLARRSDGRFEGSVAVKLLNLALLDPVGSERFRREGTTLARLAHPGIARLIDAGITDAGQPFLVLEYVEGTRIDHYCDEHRLGPDARIELFQSVLAAVSHAHANLIVHRDLKPSNILVSRDAAVKLLDFGIAKLMGEDDDPAHAELTAAGGAPLTAAYAAPEQLRGEPVTTATDVYALGILLHILLTGANPRSAAGDTRSRTPGAALTGDLGNIVAKALDEDPARRYTTADAFAADLLRHQRHEPVEARAPSLGYRAGKFVRRNRIGVAAAAVVLLTLTGATSLTSAQMLEARAQRDAARAERNRAVYEQRRASASSEFMQSLLAGIHPEEKVSTLELLGRARTLLERDHAGDPAFVARMIIDLSNQFGPTIDFPTRRALLGRAVELAGRAADPGLEALALCGLARHQAWIYVHADSVLPPLETAERALARSPGPDREARGQCLLARARTLIVGRDYRAALAMSAEALALAEQSMDTTSPAFADLLSDLADQRRVVGRPVEALLPLRRAVRILEESGRGESVRMLHALQLQYAVLGTTGYTAAADSAWTAWEALALRMGDRYAPAVENAAAQRALGAGKPDSAAAIWGRKYARQRAAGEPGAAATLAWVCRALIEAGRLPEARVRLRELAALGGPRDEELIVAGRLAEVEGRHREALESYGELLERQGFPVLRYPWAMMIYVNRAARMALLAGEPATADSIARHGDAQLMDVQPWDSLGIGRMRLLQARARLALGDTSRARAFALEADRALRAHARAAARDVAELREVGEVLGGTAGAAVTAD